MKFRVKFLIFSAFLMGWVNAFSQNFVWARGEGGVGNDASNAITTDETGNSYITGNLAGMADFSGSIYQGKGLYEVFIAKYNAQGNLLWVKTAGGAGNDMGNSIKYRNGYLYIGGYFEDTATFEGTDIISRGETDAFVAKYDSNGNFLWVRHGGGTGADVVTAIDADDDGNVYAGGHYHTAALFDTVQISTTSFYDESFICKYSPAGSLQWINSTRGVQVNQVTGLACYHNRFIYITGLFGINLKVGNRQVTSPTSSYDIFLAQLDTGGNTIWLKRAGGNIEDVAEDVAADPAGNAVITGYFAGTATFDTAQVQYLDYNDVFTAKYDSLGNNLWVRTGKGWQLDIAFAVTTDANGNIFTTGLFENGISFEGNAITGTDRDLFIVSYSPGGQFRWLAQAGGIQTCAGFGIAAKPGGNIAISGYYLHTCYFGNIAIDYADGNDLFVAEYDPPAVVNYLAEPGQANTFAIYPNPAGQQAQVYFNEPPASGTLQVTDMAGNIFYRAALTANMQLPIAAWPAGLYFVQVLTNSGQSNGKLVKQ